MNKYKLVFLMLMFASINFSCKKNKNESVDKNFEKKYLNYYQMKIKNYWIYQQYEFDENGIESSTNKFDSCYFEKDTIINNKTYFKYIEPDEFEDGKKTISLIRDSLHFVINNYGKILFSSESFEKILFTQYLILNGDSFFKLDRKINNLKIDISVPAGIFSTLNVQNSYFLYPKYAPNNIQNPRIQNKYYAENIGLIKESLSFLVNSKRYNERRLVRYRIY